MQTTTKHPPRITRNPFVAVALAVSLQLQLTRSAIANNVKDWVAPSFKYESRSKHKPHQGSQEIARRKKQLASGFIQTN